VYLDNGQPKAAVAASDRHTLPPDVRRVDDSVNVENAGVLLGLRTCEPGHLIRFGVPVPPAIQPNPSRPNAPQTAAGEWQRCSVSSSVSSVRLILDRCHHEHCTNEINLTRHCTESTCITESELRTPEQVSMVAPLTLDVASVA
jgi:hypothetical protein